MNKKRKSPQQKKALSYERDRRDTYGENNKSSRKNIPLSKALSIRSERHEKNNALRGALTAESDDQLVAVEVAVHTSEPRQWKKHPGATLGEVVAKKTKRRESNGCS